MGLVLVKPFTLVIDRDIAYKVLKGDFKLKSKQIDNNCSNYTMQL